MYDTDDSDLHLGSNAHYLPHGFFPVGSLRRLVAGLREDAPPSEIRIYDASGKLLRIEQPPQVIPKFNNRRRHNG